MHYHRILFVDDNLWSNMENCEFLRWSSYNVSGVYCAAEALKLIANGEPWSALVTDIDLGLGMDGFDVARHARMSYPHLPVVFISGGETAPERARGVAESEFIAKPFRPRQLVEALCRALPRQAA